MHTLIESETLGKPLSHSPRRWWRRWLQAAHRTHLGAGCFLVLVLAAGWAPNASAASCSGFTSNLVFGVADLLNTGTTDTQSTLTYGCSGNPGEQVEICVGMGPSLTTGNNFNPRYLNLDQPPTQGKMAFNLYTDPARTSIWGDFGAAGYTVPAYILRFGASQYYITETQAVYGRIMSRGQTGLHPGLYNTHGFPGWPMHLRYQSFTGSTPPPCSSADMTQDSSAYYIAADVMSDCRIGSISTLNFGTVFQTLTQNTDSSATVSVTCNGASYYVLMGYGENANGQQRRMRGPNGDLLNYGLYLDPGRSQPWGNTNNVAMAGTGNGQAQNIPVYGRVPVQPVPTAGVYTDTVVVTVSY